MSATAEAWKSDWVLEPPLILADGAALKFAPTAALSAGFDATVTSGGAL